MKRLGIAALIALLAAPAAFAAPQYYWQDPLESAFGELHKAAMTKHGGCPSCANRMAQPERQPPELLLRRQ